MPVMQNLALKFVRFMVGMSLLCFVNRVFLNTKKNVKILRIMPPCLYTIRHARAFVRMKVARLIKNGMGLGKVSGFVCLMKRDPSVFFYFLITKAPSCFGRSFLVFRLLIIKVLWVGGNVRQRRTT